MCPVLAAATCPLTTNHVRPFGIGTEVAWDWHWILPAGRFQRGSAAVLKLHLAPAVQMFQGSCDSGGSLNEQSEQFYPRLASFTLTHHPTAYSAVPLPLIQ